MNYHMLETFDRGNIGEWANPNQLEGKILAVSYMYSYNWL